MTSVLVTGSAGFIGCHVASALLERGYHVRVLDSLIAQVHQDRRDPLRLAREAEFIGGDIRDAQTRARARRR